jgi:hypothetical protein
MTMAEAIASARAESDVRKAAGFDQVALDEAAKQGFAEGAFEESEEDGAAVVEEFFPDEIESGATGYSVGTGIKPGLADKLNQKAEKLNGAGASAQGTLAARPALED